MRRRIAFQGIRGQVELLPSMEGSVFRSFYDMQGKLDAQSGQTPQASADAEQMREHIESVLTDSSPWVEWLRVLFREIEGASETQLRGTVYAVELSHNGPPEEETLDAVPHAIVLHRVRETQIQALLSPVAAPPPPDDNGAGDPNPPTEDPAPPGRPPAAPAPVSAREDAADSSAAPGPGPLPMAPEPDSWRQGIRFPVGERLGGNTRNPLYLHPSNTRLTQLNIGIVGDLGTGKTQLNASYERYPSTRFRRNAGCGIHDASNTATRRVQKYKRTLRPARRAVAEFIYHCQWRPQPSRAWQRVCVFWTRVRPAKAGMFSGRESHRGKVSAP